MLNKQLDQNSSCISIIQQNVPLHDKNWFATGGTARFFAQPADAEQFKQALQFAHEHELPIFVLGQGANVLISDDGFDGLVIQPNMQTITFNMHTHCVTAEAGVHMSTLIEWCLDHNLIGLEEFSGIPGTVGGSVYINLHYFEFLLEQFLVSAQVIEQATGNVITVDPAWFLFGYNQSRLQNEAYYLLQATFKLTQATELEAAYARGRRHEIIRHRTKRYPTSGTCGSFFRNFHEDEVSLMLDGKKIIWVAYYLDKMGIKGNLRVGNAMVSWQHANMLINMGNATTQDIVTLARTIQKRMQEQYGIIPQPECQLIGFTTTPLLAASHVDLAK